MPKLLSFWSAEKNLVRLFTKRQVVSLWHAVEGGLGRILRAVESDGTREHCLSTDCDEEVDKLVRVKAALRSDLAEMGAQDGLEEGVFRRGRRSWKEQKAREQGWKAQGVMKERAQGLLIVMW